jgi:hypothetical protein
LLFLVRGLRHGPAAERFTEGGEYPRPVRVLPPATEFAPFGAETTCLVNEVGNSFEPSTYLATFAVNYIDA